MLTTKAVGGTPLYPYRISYAADLTELSSSGALPQECTISFWFNDGSGYEHIFIDKDIASVSVRFNNGNAKQYGGSVGSTYADLIKNVLTQYKSGYAGLYAEIHCCAQRPGIGVFAQISPGNPALWVPKKVVMPHAKYDQLIPYDEGTPEVSANLNYHGYAANVFNGTSYEYYRNTGGASGQTEVYGAKTWSEKRAVSRFGVHASYPYDLCALNWNIYLDGKRDDGTWEVVASAQNLSALKADSRHEERTDNATQYIGHRVRCTSAVTDWQVSEFFFYEPLDITYGPSGAYLDFRVADALGNDSGSENNDWTVIGSQSFNTPTQ